MEEACVVTSVEALATAAEAEHQSRRVGSAQAPRIPVALGLATARGEAAAAVAGGRCLSDGGGAARRLLLVKPWAQGSRGYGGDGCGLRVGRKREEGINLCSVSRGRAGFVELVAVVVCTLSTSPQKWAFTRVAARARHPARRHRARPLLAPRATRGRGRAAPTPVSVQM